MIPSLSSSHLPERGFIATSPPYDMRKPPVLESAGAHNRSAPRGAGEKQAAAGTGKGLRIQAKILSKAFTKGGGHLHADQSKGCDVQPLQKADGQTGVTLTRAGKNTQPPLSS